MKVIPPIPITVPQITSTVPESTAVNYSHATVYTQGQRCGVSRGTEQTVFEFLQASGSGHDISYTPEMGWEYDPLWWKNVGIVYSLWDNMITYGVDDIVSKIEQTSSYMGATVIYIRELYQSLTSGNLGNATTDETKWALIGPTNRMAMFDLERNTKTSQPETMSVTFSPGQRCNSLGLAGMVANSYALTVTSVTGGGTVYSSSGSLNGRDTLTWSDYFFGEFITQESLVFFDIPPFKDNIFTLTLTADTGNAEIGACVVGNYVYLGDTQYTAVSDVVNYSTISRDTFGEATLIPRRNVPKTTQQVWCDKTRVNIVRRLRETLNAKPALWYGIDDGMDGYFESLSILGIYKNFSISLDMPETAIINLELEEI